MEKTQKTPKASPKVSTSPRRLRETSQHEGTIDARAVAFVDASGSDLTHDNGDTAPYVPETGSLGLVNDSEPKRRGRRKLADQTKKKVQTPIMIPGALLRQVDEHIQALGTGMSRSIWICEAIKERLDKQR